MQRLLALGAEYPVRYSGTPESVEIHAPVRTVTRRTVLAQDASAAGSGSLPVSILAGRPGPGKPRGTGRRRAS